MLRRVRILLFATAVSALGTQLDDVRSAKNKLDGIERGRMKHGANVPLSSRELNAWLQNTVDSLVPQGAKDLRIETADGRAMASARVDFLRWKQAAGETPNALLRRLLQGEHPVSVVARLQSRNGEARIDLERVEVSGIPLSGAGLDFVLSTYLRNALPDVHVGEWFALDKHVDHFTVGPAGVTVKVR